MIADRDWMLNAACRGTPDPEVFFPGLGESTRPALVMCDRCPVVEECATYARSIGAQAGIWGGVERGKRGRPGRPRRAAVGRPDPDEWEEMRARYEEKYAKSLARMKRANR